MTKTGFLNCNQSFKFVRLSLGRYNNRVPEGATEYLGLIFVALGFGLIEITTTDIRFSFRLNCTFRKFYNMVWDTVDQASPFIQ